MHRAQHVAVLTQTSILRLVSQYHLNNSTFTDTDDDIDNTVDSKEDPYTNSINISDIDETEDEYLVNHDHSSFKFVHIGLDGASHNRIYSRD